ncbi:hypothetical protein FPZ12_045130 [Amycolatopsis acidicola]|uniref:Uncharacterized protein n=1 Tax=Amycolatopsis acidicola TaxID=2596893 RepID=A0A5N0UMB5_9PSEU|nr:hypothetical protein [Amycolatopsis acidicola]KAA9148132.1 hypothetical protein FPZ12_045130 [Amycolatopsis acidicola]
MRNVSERTRRAVEGFNKGVMALRSSRLLGPFVRRHLTVVGYTGRTRVAALCAPHHRPDL